ncbi:unnamed protein product, partial [marine sediment metagenome]
AKRIINSDHYKFIKNIFEHDNRDNYLHSKIERMS